MVRLEYRGRAGVQGDLGHFSCGPCEGFSLSPEGNGEPREAVMLE